jgi:hypothetical protein
MPIRLNTTGAMDVAHLVSPGNLLSIHAPAIFKRPMVDGTFVIERTCGGLSLRPLQV